jgi:hypothetical protein
MGPFAPSVISSDLQQSLALGLRFYCRTIVPIVAATIETIVRHSTPKSNCVEAVASHPLRRFRGSLLLPLRDT